MWIWRTSVLLVSAIVWVWICEQILMAGSLIRYDALQSLGAQVVTFMTRINPYLWWGLTAILTLIVLSLARNWFKASVLRGRNTAVSVADIQKLSDRLSPSAADVLLWVWNHESGPVTVGDLLTTRQQLTAGRIRKLAAARSQYQALVIAQQRQSPTAADLTSKEM
jgi:hypothetical protein